MNKKDLKGRRKVVLALIGIALMIAIISGMVGCASLQSTLKDIKGELIGNSFDIMMYDNFGNNVVNITGDKVQVDNNIIKVKSVDSEGDWSTTYEMSSVTSNTIDGSNLEQVGNTVIYAEEGLNKITDFELPQNINTSGGTFNLLDRSINSIKNSIGTPKIVVISSQLGVPICVYGGDSVYYEIPDDLPKMTKLIIDGKALYVHRANYIIMDTKMLK